MPNPSRRALIQSAAAAGLVGAAIPAAAADFPFWNNVPDPELSGKELPTFKFELEKSTGRVDGGSFGKEATVEQLPISKGIAGVSMRLEPGVARELHWHATAAEWAFVLDGRCRTTVIDPQGNSQTNDFDPGDVWYFPRGHGHSIQCLGNKACHFILIFDNGYFSEFGTFSITDWVAQTPNPLLAKNLGLPETTFNSFPSNEVYFVHGPVPPERPAPPHQGRLRSPPNTHKYRLLAQEPNWCARAVGFGWSMLTSSRSRRRSLARC
ncbi:MAG: cupin domain-containing protein [Thermoguttaceae bacterium]